VDRVNSSRARTLITIEDPIEFLHRDKKGYVNQREIGVDTPSFQRRRCALSLRQRSGRDSGRRMRRSGNDFHCAARSGNGPHSFSSTCTRWMQWGNGQFGIIFSIFPPLSKKQIRLPWRQMLRAIVRQRWCGAAILRDACQGGSHDQIRLSSGKWLLVPERRIDS